MNIKRIIYGIKQRLYKKIYQKRENDTHILMFHEVTNGEEVKYPEISIEKDNFEKLLQIIQAKGYKFESVENLFEFSFKRVIISFDDIFSSVIINALPILEKYNVPFVVFITLEYIDQPGYISKEQLKQLIGNPLCTIGFHATKHVLMCEYKDKDIAKMVDSCLFREEYGIECDYFAYPYGSMYACPKRAIKEVAKLNYKAAFGTINSAVNKQTVTRNPYYIPRICVSDAAMIRVINNL